MAKGSKRKSSEEDFDLGPDEKEEVNLDGLVFEDKEEAPSDVNIPEYVDMNRIVEDDDNIPFKGTIRAEDMPECPCCGAKWLITEGMLANPGCGCAIHPVCTKCGHCEPHCSGHRK